jgi:molybdate transport system substrate-binding protein
VILLTVFAAASLTNVFPAIDRRPRYSFAGSNALAQQIRQGAPADVFASANTRLPQELYRAGVVERPVVFTHNRLVLIVPRANSARIDSLGDLRRRGVKLVVAARGVPVGDYTREIVPAAVLKNVVSEENDVREVLAKVALGEADAGFVYATDARTVRGKIRTIAMRSPLVSYAVAVVKSSRHRVAARAWVRRLRSAAAQRRLRAAGFK